MRLDRYLRDMSLAEMVRFRLHRETAAPTESITSMNECLYIGSSVFAHLIAAIRTLPDYRLRRGINHPLLTFKFYT